MKEKNKNYADAPYNFIPFPDKVVYKHKINEEDGELKRVPLHNKFDNELKSGYIKYIINVETPLFISNGNDEFFSVNGECTIPGSTIRGKVRSTAEILSSAYPEFIKDTKLWFRAPFSDNKDVLKDMYEKVVFDGSKNRDITQNIMAGYLKKSNNKYEIMPAKTIKGKSFKKIHESELRNKQDKMRDGIEKSIFMYKVNDSDTGENLWTLLDRLKQEKREINKKLEEFKKKDLVKLSEDDKKIKKQLENEIQEKEDKINDLFKKGNCSESFKPDYYRVLYEKGIKVIKRKTNNNKFGILMNSNKLDDNNKQNHYIIYRKNTENERIIINNNIVNQFKTSVKYKHKNGGNVFSLPKKSEEKPIFYLLDKNGEVSVFGFTPYLKIPYDKSTCEGIITLKDSDNSKLDYVQSIFGFTNLKYSKAGIEKAHSYKGRVSFTNAYILTKTEFEKTTHKSLMGPKISSFQLYLNQSKNNKAELKTYSGDFQLRGQKFYWLKKQYDNRDNYINQKKLPEKQFAKLTPISKGTCFEGKIYFDNLGEDELGLLLMALKPFENAKDSLGQGKPYGFGKVEFNIEEIKEIDSKERFKSLNVQNNDTLQLEEKIEKYHQEFRNFMKKNGAEIDFENDRLKYFYVSRTEEKQVGDSGFKYMKFKDDKYKDRKVLKSMEEYSHNIDVNIMKNNKSSAELVAEDKEISEEYLSKLEDRFKVTRKRK